MSPLKKGVKTNEHKNHRLLPLVVICNIAIARITAVMLVKYKKYKNIKITEVRTSGSTLYLSQPQQDAIIQNKTKKN